MKIKLAVAAALAAGLAGADVLVTVDTAKEIGPVKIMNAVNNGPSKARADQSRGNFADYRALRIPYARTHDSINQATSNGHTVDISAVFPNFDADENDPKNYDFAYTDRFLETILAAGTEPFFRLGQTIENGIKKYHVFPPKDYAKWARVCEHVIRHCNEGWCGGHEWGIQYWEIWNEADAQPDEKKSESCQWQGTKAEFFEFYKVVAQHLKKAFPKLKIGGPALGHRLDWAEDFLKFQQAAGTPIDFFSWHWYGRNPVGDRGPKGPSSLSGKCFKVRALLDRFGYGKAESILDEWNYVKDWTEDFPYTCRVISEPKGGAFAAAALSGCQDAPLDMLMYYDARPGAVFNGLFDIYTFKPRPAYYAFLAWSWLRDLGTQVATAVSFPGREKLVADANSKQWKDWFLDYENPGISTNEAVTAVAAFSKGKVGVLVTRYCDDDNVTAPERVSLRLRKGAFNGLVRAHVTDQFHTGSAMTVIPEKDGSIVLSMEPNSFVYVEAELKPLDVVLKENLDFCAEAGIESFTNAWEKCETADAWKRFGFEMGRAAEVAQDWKLPVSFHNHFHEFTMKYDGVCAWDLVFQNSSPLLQQQLDSGQVVHPGEDCVARVKRYPGRNFSMHMKENTPSEWGFFGVPPDDGGKMVPWQDLVDCLEDEPSFRWYVIESERKPDSFLPAEKNLNFLRALVWRGRK